MTSKKKRPEPVRFDPVADHMREILRELGEDPAREGIVRTPERFARAMRHLTSGYGMDPREVERACSSRRRARS